MNFKNNIKHYLGHRHPRLFIFMYRLLAPMYHANSLLLSENTEIVIEGFPRSANTFAVVAFEAAQNRPVNIAHHLHVEAQIIEGVRLNIPVIVLIRDPIDAFKSLLIRYPGISMEKMMTRYIDFYSSMLKVKSSIVIAEFEEVTSNFGLVVERVNQKYGTHFVPFSPSPENVQAVMNKIEQINNFYEEGSERHVARPSQLRESLAEDIVVNGDHPLVSRANELRWMLVGLKP